MQTVIPRYKKALDMIKQFASLQARLEGELSDAHRDLSHVRSDYLQLGLRCSALASERDALRRRAEKAEEYIEALHAEPGSGGREQAEADREIRERLAALESELEQAHSRHRELETEVAERGSYIEALQDKVAAGQAHEAELGTELQQLTQRLQVAERENKASSDRNRALLAQLDSVRSGAVDAAGNDRRQIEALQRRLDEITSLHSELVEAYRGEREQFANDLRNQLEPLRAELDQARTGYKDLEQAFAERGCKVEVLEERVAAHLAHEAELAAQSEHLMQRLTTAEQEHGAASEQNRALAAELENVRAASAETARNDREQIAAMQRRLDEMTAAHAELDQAYREREQQIGSLYDELASLRSGLEQAQARHHDLEMALAEREQQRDAASEQSRALAAELENVRAASAETARNDREQIAALQRRLDEMTAAHAELDQAYREREQQVSALHDELASLRSGLEQAQARHHDLEIALAEREQQHDAASEQSRALAAELENVRAASVETARNDREQIAALQRRLDEMTAAHAELDQAYREREQQVGALHDELASLRSGLEQAQSRYGVLELELARREQQVETLEDRAGAHRARESELEAQDRELSQRLSAAEQQHASALERNRELVAELEHIRATFEETAARNREQSQALQQRVDEMTSLHAALNNAYQEQQQLLGSLRDELASVHGKLNQAQARHRDLEIELAEREQQVDALEQAVEANRAREAELNTQCNELRERLSDAQREHAAVRDSKRRQVEELHRRIIDLEMGRDAASHEMQVLEQEVADALVERNGTLEQIRALESKLADQSREHEVRLGALQDSLSQVESERQRFQHSESELVESLRQTRHQLEVAHQVVNDEALARKRERRVSVALIVISAAVLLGVLFNTVRTWQRKVVAPELARTAEDVAVVQQQYPEMRDEAVTDKTVTDKGGIGKTATGETVAAKIVAQQKAAIASRADREKPGVARRSTAGPLVQAYLMASGDSAVRDSACAQWGVEGEKCAELDDGAFDKSVIHLDSGVKYRVIRNGTGAAPQPGDSVVVNYRGTLLDGTEFDSSSPDGAAELSLGQLVPGLQEALQRMEEGAHWVVYIPPNLAYRKPDALAGEAVVFDVELVSIGSGKHVVTEIASVQWLGDGSGAEDDESRLDVFSQEAASGPQASHSREQALADEKAFFAKNARRAGVVSLPSGLQYKVLKHGSGKSPKVSDKVILDYRAVLFDGSQFDSSAGRDQAGLRLNELVPGLQEAVAKMHEGDRWVLYVPHGLAQSKGTRRRGKGGLQPVIYEVELLSVQE